MSVGIDAEGFIGIAFEATAGTYVAPTKYFPIISETLRYKQSTQYRRVIRGLADPLGAVQGFSNVEGDIEAELMEDMFPYFLHVGRSSISKTGTTDLTYVTTPTHTAVGASVKPAMSITVVRAGVAFGYTGCVLSGYEVTVQQGIPRIKYNIVGLNEATESVPTYTALATSIPFAPGEYSIEVPTASQIFDVDNFTLSVNDNAVAENRLSDTTIPTYIRWGQRDIALELDRDFDGRTEYDAYKALTSQSITVALTKSATKKISFLFANTIMDDYDLKGLTDQGELTRAKIKYMPQYDSSTSKSVEVTVICQENIT